MIMLSCGCDCGPHLAKLRCTFWVGPLGLMNRMTTGIHDIGFTKQPYGKTTCLLPPAQDPSRNHGSSVARQL